MGMSWVEAVGAALGVEAIELAMSSSSPKPDDESTRNQIGDLIVFVAGYYIADRTKRAR
tara:strand:+ start:4813 stop:4989 length:177 start_codon:yes stop_codon:yes gene_type:complete